MTVAVVAVLLFYTISNVLSNNRDREQLIAETALIQKQINNVAKLVVTEVKYAKVYNYENTKSYSLDFFTSQKTTLIISNATAQVSYDLKQLKHEIDAENKTIRITYIPQAEIHIDPNLTFYRMDDGLINKFEGKDYNTINKKIKAALLEEIKNDDVMKNAQNRLLSELNNIYILSNNMNWKLVYKETEIQNTQEMERILF
jgi:hypothetical protein